jgi:TolA-binding protein
MNRWIVVACIAATLCAGTRGWTEDAKNKTDLGSYLQELQVKLDHAAQRANQPSAGGSSVVGVRGSQQEPLSKQLYWKGKKSRATVTPEEVKMMHDAVDQARAGQTKDAISSLKAFEEHYPNSALKPDAEETLRRLNEPAAPPAAKS